MAWFGESLSSLTGHLQNLTKEVLSEAGDGTKNAVEDLKTAKEKLEELEAVCSAQDLEITALKKQNCDLRRRLEEAGLWAQSARAEGRARGYPWSSVGAAAGRCHPSSFCSSLYQQERFSRRFHRAAPQTVVMGIGVGIEMGISIGVGVSAPAAAATAAAAASRAWSFPEEHSLGSQPTTTWLSIEQRCDAGYKGGGRPRGSGNGHARSLSDVAVVKHQERLEKELTDKIQIIEHLQTQLQNVEKEHHVLSVKSKDQEKQIAQTKQKFVSDEEILKNKIINEEKLLQVNNELQNQLQESNLRAKELEEELLNMRSQCLDTVIDSQVSTSEIRSDVEQTRKRIAYENGTQKAERLRAHQDMVNRMIQIGEKSRENDNNVKKLQSEDNKLVAEIISQIQKLGDQEQQDLIHGTLKALELENQVLNMRNVQLEHEAYKDSGSRANEKPNYLGDSNGSGKNIDADDTDNTSFQSEQSDFTVFSTKLENQITQLQNNVEVYKKEVERLENVEKEMSEENQALVNQVTSLSALLKGKNETQITSAKESSVQTEKLRDDEKIVQRLVELEEDLQKSKLSLQQVLIEKQCLGQELEAMARVVQDLESKVAVGEEERQALITSMEELDEQHQDALDKLLTLRKTDQMENEELRSQVKELKLAITQKSLSSENAVQTDNVSTSDKDVSTHVVTSADKSNQAHVDVVDESTLTIDTRSESLVDPLKKFDSELCERIKKYANFDIPNDFNKAQPYSFYLVKEIVKIANDSKWKKDTLERKVSELIRENKDAKCTIEILEAECSNLKDNIERLAEQLVGVAKAGKDPLPTILENCEEMEILEQKNATLEVEVEVLKETRVNLEQDAMRMREDQQELVRRIRNLEAHVRNHDNLQREVDRLNRAASSVATTEAALAAAESNRISVEVKAESLSQELESMTEKFESDLNRYEKATKQAEVKCEESIQTALRKEQEVQEMKNIVKGLEEEKTSLLLRLQEKSQQLEETCFKLRENTQERQILDLKIAELQKHFEEEKELREKLTKASGDLELSAKMKLDLENQLHALSQRLQSAEYQMQTKEELESELSKWKNEASSKEQNYLHVLETLKNLTNENEILKEQINCNEVNELTEKLEASFTNEATLRSARDNFEKSLKIATHEKAELEQSVNYLTNQVKLLSKQVEESRSELSQTELAIQQYQEIIHQMKENIKSLEADLHDKFQKEKTDIFNKSYEEMKKVKAEVIESENLKRVSLLSEVEYLKSDLASIKGANEMLKGEKDKLTSLVREQEESLFNLPQLQEKMFILEKEKEELLNKIKCLENVEKRDEIAQCERCAMNSHEFKQLLDEKEKLDLLLNGKIQEVELLKSQLQHFALNVERDKEVIMKLQEENSSNLLDNSKIEEKFNITKETVTKLSEMIREKDQQIELMKSQISEFTTVIKESENVQQELQRAQLTVTQVVQERDQILQTVHIKHQESIQYHNEIQRLSQVLSQEMAKQQHLSTQYNALVKKCEENETNGSPIHRQELQTLQDLVRVKDEGMHQLCNRLELQEQELRARGMELDLLRHQIETMTYERGPHYKEGRGSSDFNELEENFKKITSTLKEEQRKSKQLQSEFELCQGREISLQRELERLRLHLVEIEDTYTQEALKTEEHIKDLQSKLQQAEEMMMSSSTVYKSANIRANQQVETLQEQARLIAQQRDDVQDKLSAAEDEVAKHAAALRNLQTVLEQFQRDKEREIEVAKASVYVKVEAAKEKHNELLGEISSLKSQLKEAKEGLSAASRLGQELEKKTEMVIGYKQEVAELSEKLKEARKVAQTINENADTKVDKSLVKNVVLGYFLAPANSQAQVLHVVSSVLGFSEDERTRIEKKLGYYGSESGGGILKSLLHPSGPSNNPSQQSLSEAFIRFLENESIPQAKLKMIPDGSNSSMASGSRHTTPRANTPVSSQNKTPLLLTDVQLPTFAQLPAGRNSSSLLKDILRES